MQMDPYNQIEMATQITPTQVLSIEINGYVDGP